MEQEYKTEQALGWRGLILAQDLSEAQRQITALRAQVETLQSVLVSYGHKPDCPIVAGQHIDRLCGCSGAVEFRLQAMTKLANELYMLINAATAVAQRRGDTYGLCDAMAHGGHPYVSEWSEKLISRAQELLAVGRSASAQDKSP